MPKKLKHQNNEQDAVINPIPNNLTPHSRSRQRRKICPFAKSCLFLWILRTLGICFEANSTSGSSLKLEMDGEELTEQETALYDRQIRVWGADAQRRLSKSHILVYGIKGTVAEFCKNIVLAGVGSLTLVDDRVVNEEALSANFLILPDDNLFQGKTLAEVCCDSLKEFNPMVRVSVEKGDISTFGVEFFEKFDVVVISCCSLAKKVLLDNFVIYGSYSL
ncbi:THIF-type NAD/FAD binding fold - like 4 [Theobroma cacao]|nr:THIF-type NAD/FAD binding fold - like 4 [Theobroma cacao]